MNTPNPKSPETGLLADFAANYKTLANQAVSFTRDLKSNKVALGKKFDSLKQENDAMLAKLRTADENKGQSTSRDSIAKFVNEIGGEMVEYSLKLSRAKTTVEAVDNIFGHETMNPMLFAGSEMKRDGFKIQNLLHGLKNNVVNAETDFHKNFVKNVTNGTIYKGMAHDEKKAYLPFSVVNPQAYEYMRKCAMREGFDDLQGVGQFGDTNTATGNDPSGGANNPVGGSIQRPAFRADLFQESYYSIPLMQKLGVSIIPTAGNIGVPIQTNQLTPQFVNEGAAYTNVSFALASYDTSPKQLTFQFYMTVLANMLDQLGLTAQFARQVMISAEIVKESQGLFYGTGGTNNLTPLIADTSIINVNPITAGSFSYSDYCAIENALLQNLAPNSGGKISMVVSPGQLGSLKQTAYTASGITSVLAGKDSYLAARDLNNIAEADMPSMRVFATQFLLDNWGSAPSTSKLVLAGDFSRFLNVMYPVYQITFDPYTAGAQGYNHWFGAIYTDVLSRRGRSFTKTIV